MAACPEAVCPEAALAVGYWWVVAVVAVVVVAVVVVGVEACPQWGTGLGVEGVHILQVPPGVVVAG